MPPNKYFEQGIKKALLDNFKQQSKTLNSNWLNTLVFELQQNRILYIYFPHQFFSDWFATNIKNEFENLIYSQYPSIQAIKYKVSSTQNHSQLSLYQYHYDSDYLFEDFLYNQKNKNTYIAANKYAEQEMDINPFLLCGDKGSGKSHLIKATANKYLQSRQNGNILYLPFQDFSNVYPSSISKRKETRKQFQTFDIVIIEDLHLLSNYPFIQEEFKYLYETLYENRVLMLFTCTGKPSSIYNIDKNLRSRLEAGLMLYLQKPDLDIRLEYIKKKCALNRISLKKRSILNIGQQYDNFNILKSLLEKIFEKVNKNQGMIDDAEINKIISQNKSQSETKLTFEYILYIVADHFQIQQSEIISKNRNKNTVLARQTGMYLCRLFFKYPYSHIGFLFGGRDHSTVLYSIEKIKKLRSNNQKIDSLLNSLVILCQKS